MTRLEEIFEKQSQVRAASAAPAPQAEDELDYIRFEIGPSLYAVPIGAVREVLERQRIAPYPRKVPGHLGIISLRGQVIPVLTLPGGDPAAAALERDPHARMLVLEFEPGRVFALLARAPRKISLPASWKTGETAGSDGRPVRLLGAQTFSQQTEDPQ